MPAPQADRAALSEKVLSEFVARNRNGARVPSALRQKSEALLEIEANLKVASTAVGEKLSSFRTAVWDTRRGDFALLTPDKQEELAEAYADMRLANDIVWLTMEVGRRSPDLEAGYSRLCAKIAERLTTVKPLLKG